jgi:hypothetical protein
MSPNRPIVLVAALVIGLAVFLWFSWRDAPAPDAPSPAETRVGAAAPPTEPVAIDAADDDRRGAPPPVHDRAAAETVETSAPAEASGGASGDEPATGDHPWTGDPAEIEGVDQEQDAAPSGFLDAESISAGIGESLGEIRECYEAWLGRNPNLEGKLLVEFTIATDEEDEELGVVTAIEIADSTVDHVWMEGCVASVMQDVQFPPPEEGEVQVKYPFYFSTGD